MATDRADEIARAYRQSYLLNVTLAVAAKTEGALREACDAAEKQFAAALRSYGADCRNEGLEKAAKRFLRGGGIRHAHEIAEIVRSLKTSPSTQENGK